MKKVQLLIIICFVTISRTMAQDTVIIRRNVEVQNPTFLMIMDSVISHTNECVFFNEVPSCIIVSRVKWQEIDCYRFSSVPIDNSDMYLYEVALHFGEYYPYHYKSYLFLFQFVDSIVSLSNTNDTVIANPNQWVNYLYMPNIDKPLRQDPLESIDLYKVKDLSFFKRFPCKNVSDMIRIIDTPETKLFIPNQVVKNIKILDDTTQRLMDKN